MEELSSTVKFHGVPLGDTNAIPIPVPLKGASISGCGTMLTSRSDRAKSAFGGIADNKCSKRAFPLMTDTVEKVLVNFGEQ
jgi:hypothetical protein